MNLAGAYTPWGVNANGNSPSDYVPAWRHVHDIFTSVGATNATWVWCPNIEYQGSYKPLSSLYPGDAYVDWTCLDGDNWGTNPWNPNVWTTFAQTFGASDSLITGTIAPSKPMVIGETASTEYGGSKAAWITDMLKTQLPLNFPKIKGFLGFEAWDSRGYDSPMRPPARPSPPSLRISSCRATPPTSSLASEAERFNLSRRLDSPGPSAASRPTVRGD